MSSAAPAPSPTPAALAAFLRGVERRAAVLAELQAGDAVNGDAALAAAMREFRDGAAGLPMGEWPRRFWSLLLAQPALRQRVPVALALEATDRLGELGSGPRAALLLRLAAGLEDAEAAAVLGVGTSSYRMALQRALPCDADGQPDAQLWHRLREQVHRRIKTLPTARLLQLTRAREAVLAGTAGDPPRPRTRGFQTRGSAPSWQRPVRSRPRWLLPLLWSLLALCAAAFAATFWWPLREPGQAAADRPPNGLPQEAPASRYGATAGLVSHRDFALLADPAGEQQAQDLAFHSWLLAQDKLEAEPE